jgi:malate dehydrogenase
MGEHGDSQVPIFSSIRVDNQPISLSEPIKQELRRKPAERMRRTLSLKAGRTTGWSSGLGLAAMLKAIRNDTREMFPCCAVLAGEYGYEGFSMTVPLILGRQGIHEVLEWKLDPEEKEGLERSVSILKTAAHYVEETLGTTSKM